MDTSEGQANSSSTPCAACKLLRRRCVQDCPFSPYFSPHEPQKFACVHKVFGASNVSKMLMEVPESQRADAASSLVYEAKARIRDPVYGCMGAISALQQQAQSLQTELNAVRREIMRYKHHDNNIVVADAPAATASAMMVSGYQRHNLISDRGFVVVNPHSTQTTASDFYNIPSCNNGATPGLKERRYW
jgi:MinD-like ATPase involved in chromosome partitioning or flagellar assembly